MSTRRVVVTGLGVLSPVGNTVDEFWSALLQGRSGIGPITKFDTAGYPTRIAGEVRNFDPLNFVDKKDARRLDPYLQYAVAASALAVQDAALETSKVDASRFGVLIGSGIGGITTLLESHRNLLEKGPDRVSPFFIPMLIVNMASGLVSMRFGAKGPNSSVVTACATGNHAIGDSFEILQRGDADVMIAGGSEAIIIPLTIAGFCSMKAMSTRNEEPTKAMRPFDATRDGFVCGEGAGIVVLETLEHAQARDARIYAEIIGYGMTGDAHHMTAPDPEGDGAARAMAMAVRDAGLEPSAVGYINAHGTSTPYNDKFETLAIKRVFGEHARRLAVSSTKSMTGHLLGAAGGIEAIATVLALHHGVLPPTINYETPDPDCDLDYIPNQARKQNVEVAISNAFGFGGTNATLAFRTYLG
ncbi:MAG TPA: beta-ketoacyl-ACP synthase II [Methylomirabilota bacterium]|nr:beta-ketoacyl-ACP synthase II [Methylomirabilota bacterium]